MRRSPERFRGGPGHPADPVRESEIRRVLTRIEAVPAETHRERQREKQWEMRWEMARDGKG
ncbi:hypothetical protein GCM10009647_054860 [Streptomyces sanglieri]